MQSSLAFFFVFERGSPQYFKTHFSRIHEKTVRLTVVQFVFPKISEVSGRGSSPATLLRSPEKGWAVVRLLVRMWVPQDKSASRKVHPEIYGGKAC